MVIAKACKKYLSMFPLIRLPYMPYFIAGICDKEYQRGISEFVMMRNSKQLNVLEYSFLKHTAD